MTKLALSRRLLFVLTLLFVGAITIAINQKIYQEHPSLVPLGRVLWGFDSLALILAFWVAGRIREWMSWSTWARVTTYFLAFSYGGMLFDATQDWWTGTVPTFSLPGLVYQDYARPLLSVLRALCLTLFLMPILRGLGYTFIESDSQAPSTSVSILDLLAWTALAALICVWIRVLNSELAPTTGYSHAGLVHNFKVQFVYALIAMIPAGLLIVQCIAWRRHWLLAVGVLVLGWVIDSLGTGLATQWLDQWLGMKFGILSGDGMERWCYVGGRSLLGFCFGGLALCFGVSLKREQAST